MQMSHSRSIKLITELNMLGSKPLIETRAGGEAGAGAMLTDLGGTVLALYADLERSVEDATSEKIAHLAQLIDGE